MRIKTDEPSLLAMFAKGQVNLIATEFVRRDAVVAALVAEVYHLRDFTKKVEQLQAENERLRLAGDEMADGISFALARTDGKEPRLVLDWNAAKEGKSSV